jgi:hypothetical protein
LLQKKNFMQNPDALLASLSNGKLSENLSRCLDKNHVLQDMIDDSAQIRIGCFSETSLQSSRHDFFSLCSVVAACEQTGISNGCTEISIIRARKYSTRFRMNNCHDLRMEDCGSTHFAYLEQFLLEPFFLAMLLEAVAYHFREFLARALHWYTTVASSDRHLYKSISALLQGKGVISKLGRRQQMEGTP